MSNPKVRKAKQQVMNEKSAELKRIYDAYGELKPSTVVEEARNEASPIHNDFEWDDAVAAHEHRLLQARNLIRIHVVVRSPESEPERYVHVPPPPQQRKNDAEGAYHPISVVIENVDWFERAIGELEAKLRAATLAAQELRNAAEESGTVDQQRMAQITLAMTALKTASDVVKSLH